MTYPLCPRLPCVSPTSVEWGTVAEWATVVVALLALAAAAVTAWFASTAAVAARRQADAAERTFAEDARTRAEAQPRKVYAIEYRRSKSAVGDPVMSLFQGSRTPEFVDDRTMWDIVEDERVFTEMVLHVGIEVCNLSDEVVGRVVLTLVDPMSGVHSVTRHAVTVIMPGQSRDFEMLIGIPEGWDPSLPADDIMPALQPLLEFRDSGGQWWSRQGTDPIERLERGVHELP